MILYFTKLLHEHADPFYTHTTVVTDSPRSDKTCNVSWMSDECLNLKKECLNSGFSSVVNEHVLRVW